ncbi:hypothetical protein [Mangrovicoccus sp. HB161399]|uniref:hypothetical protein n=1 Tax=Mangrovicoccus sp. HB161399 TaxID=2720392 RepID=UPI0015525F21|nr:hypothetical protein [Mangrovicoccus sp. HB161399]
MSRTPDAAAALLGEALAVAVLLAECPEDLPCRSRIIAVTRSGWISMSFSEQQLIANAQHDKLERCRRRNSATDQRADIDGSGNGNAMVCPMRLGDLP